MLGTLGLELAPVRHGELRPFSYGSSIECILRVIICRVYRVLGLGFIIPTASSGLSDTGVLRAGPSLKPFLRNLSQHRQSSVSPQVFDSTCVLVSS